MKISFNPSNSNKNILDLIKNNKDIIFDLKGHSIFARGVEFKGTDTNTWRDIKINNVSIGSHTLDLRNGSNTTLTNTNGVVTINSTWRPVVDNLTSDSTTSSLSAKQGKVLKALIDGKSNSGHTHDDRYLKLTGGTMAGNALITFADSGSWSTDKGPQGARGGLYWTGQSDYAKLYAEETAGDNLDLVIQFGDDNSNGLSIRNKANTQTSYISAGGVITTGTFKGNLDWSYITNKPSSYTPSAHTHAWNSLTHSSTTENQAILTNGKANGWKLQTLNIARWDNAANNAHSHANKSVLDGITSALVNSWNTAYNFVSNITGTDTDKVINKWEEIVNFLAGITEDNKLNTLLNSKLSIQQLSAKDILTTKTNNALFWVDTKGNASTITTGPFTDHPYALLSVTNYNQNAENYKFFYRSRLAFSSAGDIKVASCHHENEYQQDETWYNVLTSKNSGINGSTIKLNGTSITVYSSGTADGRYVKKSGDTMSGVLTIDTPNFGALTIKRNDDANGASIQFRGKSSVYGYIGLNNSTKDKQFLRWSSDTSRIYTILDTSSTYISNGKGVINGTTITQVDNATNSTNSTNARKLVNWYSARPTSLNAQFGDGSLRIFYATSSTTEGKPAEDSHILHLAWDNTGGYDAQLAVHARSGKVSTRAQNGGTWQPWKTLAFTTDIPTSLKNPYSFNVFGVVYDGSAAKTVTTSNFISQVNEGTSTITDGTMLITSYASNSGFADTNAVNVPYKRKAIHLWEYIKAKTDSLYATKGHNHDGKYLKLTGGTMLGALNFANNTWNLVGDDSYIGDCNISGHFGIKAANTTYPGITFFNNASTFLGNLTAYSGNIKYGAYSLQFLDNGNTSVSASTWTNPFSNYNSNAVADGQAICVWGQSSYLSNLSTDTGDMSLWLKRINANGATLNMVLDGEYYANGNQRLAHVSEIPNKDSWNYDDRYLRLTGGWMSGNINFGGDNKIHWGRNTDSASISFKNDGEGDANSYMSFVTSDNGNEYFRWSHSSGSTNTEWMALRSDGLRVRGTKVSLEGHTHTVFKNNLMIKGTNGISDSASIHLGIGDSDTGFKWISDGVCQIYANNAAVGQWTSGGMNWFKNPTVNGNKVWNAGNDGSGSGLDADTLDGYHAASFVKMKQFRFNQYKKGFWTKILTITINSTSDLQPVIAFNWIPSECAREVWAEFTINWRSNSPIFYAIWKGTAVRTLTCVNSSGNIWNVWVQGDKNSYDPFGEVQVTYAHNISSYNGGSLGYSDSDPGGTRCTLGGYVNYARSTGNADTVDGQHASAFSYKSWWHWYGKDGQPNWLWGGNNENDYYVYNPSNFRVAYAASAGNADTLDGYPANGSNDRPYGHIPTIESDGVMEVGRYIDFHNDNNGKHDFSTRLQSTGNYGNEVNLPSASGTLALINDVNNYYWANVKISTSSSTTTSPTVHTLTATRVCAGHNPGIDNSISCSNWFRSSGNTGWYNTTYQGGWYMSDTSWIRAHNGVGIYTSGQIYSSSSIRMSNILLEHTDEINNSANGGIHLNYRNSGNVSLCYGGGNVGIGTTTPSYKLDVNGQMRASGFHHASVNSDNYMLLAGGGYKSFGGDDSTPIFLGCLDLYRGGDGTISSSFYCLGYSVPFTYTRGGNYCKIVIPDTTRLSFYIIAATASVNYSGGGMDTWTGYHRGSGAWWLHCYAFGWNEVRVKGFCQADKNNDSWWGGNPLWNNEYGANRITVCIFGHVKYK